MMIHFRYWLADLISGGALTRLEIRSERASAIREQEFSTSHVQLRSEIAFLEAFNAEWETDAACYRTALRAIAAEVKPTSNATVKRMGRIASEAMK
jgi:hypothetical protein